MLWTIESASDKKVLQQFDLWVHHLDRTNTQSSDDTSAHTCTCESSGFHGLSLGMHSAQCL